MLGLGVRVSPNPSPNPNPNPNLTVQRVRVLATEAMDLLASPVGPPAPFDALLEYEAKAGEARRS